MTETKSDRVEAFEYRAEMKQLLHLLVHSLYTHKEVFLRELISNASDALNHIRFRMLTDANVVDPEAPLEISIRVDPEAGTLSVEDTGVGMTHDDLVERIGTVASSGTLSLLEQLRTSGKPLDGQLIGQFGVGFYSVFMVADAVTIETRHADPEARAYRWRSDGGSQYTIEETDRPARGTLVTLHLKEDAREFSQEYRVRQVIQKYSNFVDFPVFLAGAQVNRVKALWHRHKEEATEEEREAFYKFIANDFEPPLGHLHLHIEGRVNIRALLFVPARAPAMLFREEEKGLHLYSSKVFIQDDAAALLPEYLRFVKGVVDTEDLPLNVSREVTQASPIMAKIRTILTSKVLNLLEGWAKDEPEKYARFFRTFGPLFKLGITGDASHRDQIVELLRYESTRGEAGTLTSLRDYVGRMKEGQDAIYYLLGEHRDVAERNPNLEYFRSHGLEVLLLLDPVDVFTISALDRYDGKPVQSIEKADLELKQDDALEREALAPGALERLVALFKAALGDRVEDVRVSRRLVDSAVTLVVGQQGMDAQMERVMKMMHEGFSGSKKVLEINPSHALIKNLANLQKAERQRDVLEKSIMQLYEGALLLEGSLSAPADFVARMTDLLVEATARDAATPASETDD